MCILICTEVLISLVEMLRGKNSIVPFKENS